MPVGAFRAPNSSAPPLLAETRLGRVTDASAPRHRDWTGSRLSPVKILGASNCSDADRADHDFYATDPRAVSLLLERESFAPVILEPCCGQGHIAKVLVAAGHTVIARDLIDRGYGSAPHDFLASTDTDGDLDIITNPPYAFAADFVRRALATVGPGHKVAMFLKLTFLEGKGRRALFAEHPPRHVYVSVSRLTCGKNGTEWNPSAVAYAWFVWLKGFRGEPTIRWFN